VSRPGPETIAARKSARLAAVQALYQMETSGSSPATAMRDVQEGRLPWDENGVMDGEVDRELFGQIVELAIEKQDAVDTLLASKLAKGWRLERIDAVARAILRAGVLELWRRPDVPAPVVIDEYVEIARAFFDGPEPGFINATLDACLPAVRAGDTP